MPLPDGTTLELGSRTLVMAIVNVTPDSFADGGQCLDADSAIAHALKCVADGADILDIGGESTRPGAPELGEEEEWRRIGPVLEGLRGRVGVPISVDTYKAAIAERAIALGATVVNDISGLTYEPALAGVVARTGAAIVLMHNRGKSSDMYARALYGDVASEVRSELAACDAAARAAGIPADRILLDPGLGFAKRAEHTWAALVGLPGLAALERPILTGPSRKSFLKLAVGDLPPAERIWGTAAAVTASILFGAHIVRVHDVAEMVQVSRAADQVLEAGENQETGSFKRPGLLP
ncbi:MAG: dihydropteroate synthase [Vicinamibacterales bacterium]